MPVIGEPSTGRTSGGWVRYAKQMEDAGADALELNIYFVPSDPTVSERISLERRYIQLVRGGA